MSNDESLTALRQSVFKFKNGIPDHLRGKIYKFLLEIKFNRNNYQRNLHNFQLLSFLTNPFFDDPAQDVIQYDVERTRSACDFFRLLDNKFLLKSLLTFYSKNVCPYKQGMNELLAPLLYLIDDSFSLCDVYNAFTYIIEKYLDNIYAGEYFYKLKLLFRVYNRILWYHDPVVAYVLEQNTITPDLYCTWWFLTLFSSKHELPIVYCLWDYYFAENSKTLLLFIGTALVIHNRKEILACDPTYLPEKLSKLRIEDIMQFHTIWKLAKSLQNNTPSAIVDLLFNDNGEIKWIQNDTSHNYSSGVFIVDKDGFKDYNFPIYIIDIRSKETFEREGNLNSLHFDTNKDWTKTTATLLRSIYNMNDDDFFRVSDCENETSHIDPKICLNSNKQIKYHNISTGPSSFPTSLHINIARDKSTSNFLDGHYNMTDEMLSDGYSEQDRRAMQNFSASNCHMAILSDQLPSPIDFFLGKSMPKCTLTSVYYYLTQHCLLPRVSVIGKKLNKNTGTRNSHSVYRFNSIDKPIKSSSIGDSLNKFKNALGKFASINNSISTSMIPLDIISWSGITTLDNVHYIDCHIDLIYQPTKQPEMRWLSCHSNYRKLISLGMRDYSLNWSYSKGEQMYCLVLSKNLILVVSTPQLMDFEVCNNDKGDYFISGKKICLENPIVYCTDPTLSNWSDLISSQSKIATKANRKSIIEKGKQDKCLKKSDAEMDTPDRIRSVDAVYVYGIFHTNTISKITSAKNNYTAVSFYFSSNPHEPLFRCKFFAKEDTKMCLDLIKTLYSYSRESISNDDSN